MCIRDRITENGTQFNLSEYEGKVVVISFLFTRCPDVCPVVVQSLKWLSQQFPDEYKSELEIIAVTVAPWLNTPESMKQWKEKMSADWNFLSWNVDPDNDGTWNPEEMAVMEEVWGAFDVGLQTYKANGTNNSETSGRHHPFEYFIDHTTSTFILDKNLKQRIEWMDLDWVPELVEKDVRHHLKEKVYKSVIPRNVRISEAPSHGLPVLLYDTKCYGSKAYAALSAEVILQEEI